VQAALHPPSLDNSFEINQAHRTRGVAPIRLNLHPHCGLVPRSSLRGHVPLSLMRYGRAGPPTQL
jgi:hypothetical protein